MKAGELINKKIFLPLDQLPKLKGNRFYYHEIKGFIAIDQFEKKLVYSNQSTTLVPKHCFMIDNNGTEILIPVHDNFIIKLDRTDKNLFKYSRWIIRDFQISLKSQKTNPKVGMGILLFSSISTLTREWVRPIHLSHYD